MMKTPKTLPWHASRAGVPFDRAATLWLEAVHNATDSSSLIGDSAYWSACEDNFLALLESERQQRRSHPFGTLLRAQHRIGRLPLLAMEDILTVQRAHWQARALANAQQAVAHSA